MDRLAKQQACQLFIEQEIEKGLAEGKTHRQIGRELTALIKKYFEAEVKPETIARRADRIASATNVAPELTPVGALTIDPEFQGLLPPLTKEERNGLEASLKEEGCREALVAWDGILLDGHVRYEICNRLDIPFKVHNMTFDNRNQAMIWIIKNQLGRKNLTPQEKDLVRLSRDQIKRGGSLA